MNSLNSFEKLLIKPKPSLFKINSNRHAQTIFNENKSEIQINEQTKRIGYRNRQRMYQTEINYSNNEFQDYPAHHTNKMKFISQNQINHFPSKKIKLNTHHDHKKSTISMHSKNYLKAMRNETNISSLYINNERLFPKRLSYNDLDQIENEYDLFEKDLISLENASIKNEMHFNNHAKSQKIIKTIFDSKNPSIQDISTSFQKNKIVPSDVHLNKNPVYSKIFDPVVFDEYYKNKNCEEGLDKKINFFLLLPQILNYQNLVDSELFNNVQIDMPIFLKEEKNSTEHSKFNENIGNGQVQDENFEHTSKEKKQGSTLSEDQKYKKISKKLRRAWNLNQQIPVNVFKKQIKVLSLQNEDDLSGFSGEVLQNGSKNYFEAYEQSSCQNIRNKERKSKMEARNKIQKTINERKKRVSSCQGKEQLEYKRLVGLKRTVDSSLFSKDQDKNQEISNLLSPSTNKQFISSFHQNAKLKNNKNDFFDYIEFLDFSFKNINKPNFLDNSFES